MSLFQCLPTRPLGRSCRGLALVACFCSMIISFYSTAPTAHAAVSWDAQGMSQWWFDPTNWSNDMLPPNNATGAVTDIQINDGTFTGDLGEGVVYDPDNDPFFAAAGSMSFPAGYGPETFYRMYISRNTTNENLLTIKSGDMIIDSTTIIGRSGSTLADPNEGKVVQKGGTVTLPTNNLDIGQRESSGWGNGVWDYQGGILKVQPDGGSQGIRLSAGSDTNGAGGTGRFIMHNPTSGGYVRTFDFTVAAENGVSGGNAALDPDGITTGVGIVEFHYENGRTRPIQVDRNLSINNGLDDLSSGTRSSRLQLVVNEAACVGASCVPNDIGLFDVNFGNIFGGVINGTGDLDNDMVFNNDRVFSNAAGTVAYREGDTVSANFGGTRYDWTISYSGEISWTDADNSVVGSILGSGNGTDVVLIGLGSESVGLAGDFDMDGDVDGNDFLVWQRNTAVGSLTDWQNNYGMPSLTAAVGAVPEPGSLLLLSAAALSLIGLRRKSISM